MLPTGIAPVAENPTMALPLRIISLGWGVQSWTLAAMAALGEIPPVDFAIHADTTYEHESTYAHAAKWTPWLEEHGVRVVTVRGKRNDVVREDWTNSVMIPAFTNNLSGDRGQMQRQCTHDWKIAPIRAFMTAELKRRGIKKTPGVVQSLQGISLDEWKRMRTSDVKYIDNVYPLVDLRMSRADCAAWLERHELDVPCKSACTFCPYKKLDSWRTLKRVGGLDWQTAVAADQIIRNKRPGFELFVHPALLPLTEAVAIPEDIGAHQLGLFEAEQPCDSGICMT